MITIDLDKAQSGNVLIGRQGEHDFGEIAFVMNQWAREHPAGTVTVVYERPDGETYPVVTAARPGAVVWKPTLADLSVAGAGRLEGRITAAGGLGKSATVPVTVAPAIGQTGAVPLTPIPDWTYTVADNALRSERAAAEAEAAANTAAGAANAALEEAKSYTDEKLGDVAALNVSGAIEQHNQNGNTHPDIRQQLDNKAGTIYVDEKVSKTRMELLDYTDQQVSNTLLAAREYANTRMEGAEAYADTVGQSTLTEAQTHANTKDREFYLQTREDLSTHNNNPDAHPEIHQEIGDQMAVVLSSAKTQITSGISVHNADGSAHPWIITEAKAYTDQQIANLPEISEGGEEAFVVNFVITRNAQTGNPGFGSVDKTFADTLAALKAGQCVYANINERDADGNVDTSTGRIARPVSYGDMFIDFVTRYNYRDNLRVIFVSANTAMIEEWEDTNVSDAIFTHDTSISAHWDIRTQLTEMQTAIDGIPTLEQNVAAVLAALPTWTGGSY